MCSKKIMNLKKTISPIISFCIVTGMIQGLNIDKVMADDVSPYVLSLNRTVYSSSDNGGSTSDKLVDDDYTTRWESEWGKDNQWIYVDLGASAQITGVNIKWENAYATEYEIEVSDDEENWSSIYTQKNGKGGEEKISLNGKGRYVRLNLNKRLFEGYGYSIYEFEVYGTGGVNEPPVKLGENIALNKTAISSSVHEDWYIKPGQVDADKAIDGDNNTHWGSSLQDNQWIYVDLGSIHTIGRVVLNWDSSARSYDIEVSDDAEEWKTVYRELNSRGGKENIQLYASGRYVRMKGINRATTYEFGLKEFEIYDYVENDPKPVYEIPEKAEQVITNVGSGSYVTDMSLFTQPKEPYSKTSSIETPIPSNDWWQSLLISDLGNAVTTLPLKSKYQKQGLGLLTPSAGWVKDRTNQTEKNIDFYLMANNIDTAKMESKISGYGDYSATAVLSDNDTEKMKSTFVKGSPYIYSEFSDPNSVEIYSTAIDKIFDENGNTILGKSGDEISTDHIGIEIENTTEDPDKETITRYYGVFAPEGTVFKRGGNKIKIQLGNGEKYLSIATMPSDTDLSYFYDHAYAFVTDTKVDYDYDELTSNVTTKFEQKVDLKRKDFADTTLMCMLPSQWKRSDKETSDLSYPSVRGTLKVTEGNSFTTVDKFNGILPQFIEPLNSEYSRNTLMTYLEELDKSTSSNYMSGDAYWQGKALHPLAMGALVADQINAVEYKEKFLSKLKEILVEWYSYKPGEEEGYYFNYNPEWGTLIYKNSEFGANTGITDHHFTYGYFTFASAVLATYDSEFLNDYGSMVDLLIRDYANPSKNDSKFPQFRSFDPYEGHSWAGGYADNDDGNNQEAAGESLFGWVGEYLWGIVSDNEEYRDAGIYGFTTELNAVKQYWFNYDGDNWLPEYDHKTVGQIYGATNFYGTFFNGDSVYVYGIHWLPTSEYLTNYGIEKDKVAELYDGMRQDIIKDYHNSSDPNKGEEPDPNDVENAWKHITWPIESLSDPESVINKWDTSELQKNEMYNTYWFVNNMAALGQRTDEVWAEGGVSASVYKKDDIYTAMIWNPSDDPMTVKFRNNDGELGYTTVAPKKLVAVNPLIEGAVSKSALQAEINAAKEKVQSDYTEDSWEDFSSLLDSAVNVNNDENATTSQVDEALKNLLNAIKDLENINDIPSSDTNIALNKSVVSSSNEADGLSGKYITDGDLNSRWGSDWNNNTDNHPEYVYIDLGESYYLGSMKIKWSDAYAKNYEIQVCDENPEDENSWRKVSDIDEGNGGEEDIEFNDVNARYVRIYCKEMGLAPYGYSIKDIEIYLAVDKKELVNIIEKANELNKNDYTEESWNKFSNALELAIQINENVDAKQYQVDSIVKKLEKTMNQLVKNDGESNPDVTDESLALNKKVISSSNEADGLSGKYITDGDLNSRWGSDWINNTDNSPEYVYVDLEDVYDINKVKIYWDNAFAKNYEIQVCNENPEDENSWIKVLDIDDGNGGEDDIEFNDVNARYVRIYCKEMGLAPFGYSIKDIEIYSDADKKELDKKELVNIIEKANELNKSDYTEDSWNKFSDALESAIQINENVDAKQYELDSIVEELEKIMNQLVNNNEESNPDVTDENLSLDQEVISSSDEADGLSGEYIRDEDLDSRLSSDWINNMDNNQDHVYVDVEDV